MWLRLIQKEIFFYSSTLEIMPRQTPATTAMALFDSLKLQSDSLAFTKAIIGYSIEANKTTASIDFLGSGTMFFWRRLPIGATPRSKKVFTRNRYPATAKKN